MCFHKRRTMSLFKYQQANAQRLRCSFAKLDSLERKLVFVGTKALTVLQQDQDWYFEAKVSGSSETYAKFPKHVTT